MPPTLELEDLTHEVIGSAIEVHRLLGPGLLESAYRACLARELTLRGLETRSELSLAIEYKGLVVPDAYRMDLLIANQVVVEVKCVLTLQDIHEAQLLTYLRLANKRIGLLLNFKVQTLKQGIRRLIL